MFYGNWEEPLFYAGDVAMWLDERYSRMEIDLLDAVGTRSPVKKWSRIELNLIIEKYS